MLGNKHRYKVQLQRDDGQIIQIDYATGWDPAKVPTEEVAKSAAAEHSVGGGHVYAGISAVLQEADASA